MKIIVTGAGGWIGRAISSRAEGLGITVVAIDVPPRLEGPWSGYRAGNIADDGLYALCRDPIFRGAVCVIHCAGYAHRPVETAMDLRRFDDINRAGTGRVIELAKRLGIDRIVYLSSIAFYDWSSGTDFTETGPLLAGSAYARSKLAGERLCTESKLDFRVARLGTVFGAGDRANFAKLAVALRSSRFVIPGPGAARKSVLPLELAAELLLDLSIRERVSHNVVNLALPVAPSLRDICYSFSRVCDFPVPKRLPLPVVRLCALGGDLVARFRPKFPLTSTNLGKLTISTTVDTARMRDIWTDRRWDEFEVWMERCAGYYCTL